MVGRVLVRCFPGTRFAEVNRNDPLRLLLAFLYNGKLITKQLTRYKRGGICPTVKLLQHRLLL